MEEKIIIIGAGLSGLAAAITLNEKKIPFLLLEKESYVGGRVNTFEKKKLIIDNGFQVLLPHYKTAKKLLNYKQLNLKYYPKGASIISNKGMRWFGDPLLKKKYQTGAKINPTLLDYINIAKDVTLGTFQPKNEIESTMDYFNRIYSDEFKTEFLIPFARGIFLQKNCQKSIEQFQYYLHCFFRQGAAIPEHGMGEIPKQLLNKIPSECLHLNCKVKKIEKNIIKTSTAEFKAKHIILATDFSTFFKLINYPSQDQHWDFINNYVLTTKSDTALAPLTLVSKKSPISHINIPTLISPTLAPKGVHYMNVSTFSNVQPKLIEKEVHTLTGETNWKIQFQNHIQKALPKYRLKTPQLPNQMSCCGDWKTFASIEGAFQSGIEVAKKIINNHF